MLPSRRRTASPLLFVVILVVAFPSNLSALVGTPQALQRNSPALVPPSVRKVSSSPSLLSLRNSKHVDSDSTSDNGIDIDRNGLSSPLQKAHEALQNLDLEAAEGFLMTAVAQVNGAVMNHPPLLKCFEELFRTKIKIAQDTHPATTHSGSDSESERDSTAVAYAIAQDRMGLASLLTDQSKYQEAADELELVVQSLSALVSASSFASKHVVAALDKASSLLFRTRAMVCDWNDYDSSCESLSQSTHRALAEDTLPSVHPFEALAWPCLSLGDATAIAHEYAKRAMWEAKTAVSAEETTSKLPWTTLEERLPREKVPFVRAVTTQPRNPPEAADVIKVGYLSPDFTGRHPLAFLMQDVFRVHDTSRFEITLYSLGGEPDGSPEVDKILGINGDETNSNSNSNSNSRRWKTLEGNLETMVQSISEDNLDVIIDLCGYTGTSLVAQVMACLRSLDGTNHASTPIHVAYMGFPGSSGAPYIDYMIADEVVIPSKFRPQYTENILYMPHCYFVNSHWHIRKKPGERKPGERIATRSNLSRDHYGLPPSSFVFCCHSRPDKIDPSTFATWLRALKRTRDEGRALRYPGMAGAVLWLLRSKGSHQMEANLRAKAREILGDQEQDAIVFCDQAPRPEHLERLTLADVFLDTPAYNAHTVGCDCLSAGVPMISLLLPHHRRSDAVEDNTSTGTRNEPTTDKLASRVGASLLKSAGVSSVLSNALVVASMEEYEDRMVECARSSTSTSSDAKTTPNFASLKDHLLDQFAIAPLWDTERWVRNLETGLAAMVDLRSKGSSEADIYVMDYGSDMETH